MTYRRVAALKTADDFRNYVTQSGVDLPIDKALETGPDAPLAQPYRLKNGFVMGRHDRRPSY